MCRPVSENEVLSSWRCLGKGAEKTCYLDPEHPRVCLKLSRRGNAVQVLRERTYFKWLARRFGEGKVPFVPAYYGDFDGEKCQGYWQEALLEEDGWRMLGIAIRDKLVPRAEIERVVSAFCADMLRFNVIVSDLTLWNLFVRCRDGKIERLAAVDGLGNPEFIPLSKHFRFFGRRKAKRQWAKLLERHPELLAYDIKGP